MVYTYSFQLTQYIQARLTRAVRRDKTQTWPDNRVYYTFDGSINAVFRAAIQQGIHTLEQLICVKFIPRTNQPNYVKYRSLSSDGCSSHVGFDGGEQIIKIGPRCNTQHTIIHETGHALGLWHEQSRPDRDNYLQILLSNVESGREHNFLKRNTFEVDSQGEPYDYASVMHYRLDSFNKDDTGNTLSIINEADYEKQGSPNLGHVPTASHFDIKQLNRLYNCPGSGVPGSLSVDIQKAENLPPRDDPYVLVTAYDDGGLVVTKRTFYFNDTGNPVWNTKIDFGTSNNNWQYINVSIWDHDAVTPTNPFPDDLLTPPQSFSVNSGTQNLEHCNNIDCNIRLTFSMSLTEVCRCLNGGTCRADGTCSCTEGYGGSRCQFNRARLNVNITNAINLVNEDGSTRGVNPYIMINAYDNNGGITQKCTKPLNDTQNPEWEEHLRFGLNEWAWFTVQAFHRNYTRCPEGQQPGSPQQSGAPQRYRPQRRHRKPRQQVYTCPCDQHPGPRARRVSHAYTYVLQPTDRFSIHQQPALGSGSINFGYFFGQKRH